jgi:hypothetical protein
MVGKKRGRIEGAFTIRISLKIRNAIRGKIDSLLFFIIDPYTDDKAEREQQR